MDKTVLAANLRRLRMARGLSQAELADAAQLSRLGYRNIEAGQVAPRVDTLMRVAAALSSPLEHLLVPTRSLTHVRFRALKKMTTREEILIEAARDLDNYVLLEDLLPNEKRGFAFTAVRAAVEGQRRGPPRAKETAALTRQAAGLSHEKVEELVRDICGLLEDRGVKVLRPGVVASDGFFGLSIDEHDRGPAVVINTWDRISVERWIFTAAHELGHLILHPTAYDVSQSEENEVEENEANVFASYFLIPPKVFDKELEDTRGLALVDRVLKLKRIFKVSWQTIIFRMTERQSRDQKAQLWKRFYSDYHRRFGRHLSRTEEPEPLPPEAFFTGGPADREPKQLEQEDFIEDRRSRLVRMALDESLISLSKAADILGLDLPEMRDLANSWVA
jgi:Zn-dependent peptidase ImmA (M78 family)/DNA-binding XRE family transcriptional regulator